MKKAMFHKFTNFIQQAVETFTPNAVPQEEFVYHWKSVTSYFVDNKDAGVRIEETALPEHLTAMLRIIQEEESDLGEAGTTGACLEYLLQHRLLETLYTLGRTDHPPGMKQIVLSFFTKLLSRICHPLLPHINVHRAVQRLVKACGETKAGPTEKEEIEFLCTVCAKIKTDPYLANFFIESPKHPGEKGISNKPPQAFSLVDALLSLSYSEDARVSVKACEGLMLCASLPEQSAASALIHYTQFCQSVAGTLNQLYEKLPALVSPDDVESAEAKWGFDHIYERNEKNSFAGKRQVISFLSWLDYCDQLIAVANPQVGEALASEIHKCVLTGQLLPQLMQPSESGAIVATTYITKCLRTVCSPALLREFCYFLLGRDRNLELKDSPGHPLSKRLLERCNHLSEEVCIATLKLFDTLLQKEDEHIFHCLLLRNLLGRSYVKDTTLPTSDENKSLSAPIGDIANTEQKTRSQEPVEQSASTLVHTAASDVAPSTVVSDSTSETQKSLPEGNSEPSGDQPEKTSDSSQGDSSHSDPIQNPGSHGVTETESTPTINEVVTDEVKAEDSSQPSKQTAGEDSSVTTQANDENENIHHVPAASTSSPTSSPSPPSSPSVSSSLSSVPGYLSPKFGRSEVHKVVNCFLSLLPEEAKSSYQTADSGYDMYLRDANKQFAIQETVCKDWAWPKRPVTLAEYEMERFHEGSFLHMLLDKLLHLLDQSYSVNLLLTALISKVALIPHPNLHEFLLDPFLPTVEGTRTLYSVLTKVTNEIKHHLKSDPTFTQKLLLARKQLLGMVPTIHRILGHSLERFITARSVLRANPAKPDLQWFEDQSRMEAIIVLEEFCKELSAITFVKHHAAVTRF